MYHQIQTCQPTDPWTADHGDEVSNGARADCQINSRWVQQLSQANCCANNLDSLTFPKGVAAGVERVGPVVLKEVKVGDAFNETQ